MTFILWHYVCIRLVPLLWAILENYEIIRFPFGHYNGLWIIFNFSIWKIMLLEYKINVWVSQNILIINLCSTLEFEFVNCSLLLYRFYQQEMFSSGSPFLFYRVTYSKVLFLDVISRLWLCLHLFCYPYNFHVPYTRPTLYSVSHGYLRNSSYLFLINFHILLSVFSNCLCPMHCIIFI